MPRSFLKFISKKPVFAVVSLQAAWIFINAHFNWVILGFWNQERMLGKDLWFVASSVNCDRQHPFFSSSISAECANFYGVFFIRFLRLINFGFQNYFLVYALLFCVIVVTTSWLFCRYNTHCSFIQKVVWFLILFGPPYLLLLHRGNIDQLIFVLLTFGFYQHRKGRSNALYSILIVCSLIKFYTLPLLLMYVATNKRRNIYAWAVSFVVTVELTREYFLMDMGALRNISSSFGIAIFKEYFLKLHPQYDSLLYFLFLILISGTFIIAFASSKKRVWSKNLEFVKAVPQFGLWLLLVHGICYLVFLNYDWRLIFLLFSLFVVNRFDSVINQNYYILVAAPISWCSSGFNQVAAFGDIFLYFLFVYTSFNLLFITVTASRDYFRRRFSSK